MMLHFPKKAAEASYVRYKPEHKALTRKRIAAAAGRSFRKSGYSGVGVDGLAKEAGVTSGAFYGHFASKKAAFKEAIVSGLEELQAAITDLKGLHGESWWPEFAEFYTNQKRICDLAESCALQSLTPEITRSDEEIRALFETQLLKITELLECENGRDKALASLAMLIGGVTLSRAVSDPDLANEIAAAIKNEVIAMHKV